MQEWQAKAGASSGHAGARASLVQSPLCGSAGQRYAQEPPHEGAGCDRDNRRFGISLLIVLAFMSVGLNMISDTARLQSENDAYTRRTTLQWHPTTDAQAYGDFKEVTYALPVHRRMPLQGRAPSCRRRFPLEPPQCRKSCSARRT